MPGGIDTYVPLFQIYKAKLNIHPLSATQILKARHQYQAYQNRQVGLIHREEGRIKYLLNTLPESFTMIHDAYKAPIPATNDMVVVYVAI